MALLAVEALSVRFDTPDGTVHAVSDLEFCVDAGRTLGIVGESGSGKSQSMLATLGLLATNGRASGSVRLDGDEMLGLAPAALNQVRGDRVSMIFQDPMTSLNPYRRIGAQLAEGFVFHRGVSAADARRRAVEMLDAVHLPSAATRLRSYPHELSGGMRQRVMIAMALMCQPELLIADEPTTALDVTVQAQILALLAELRDEFGMAMILITHDLGVVAGTCDDVLVMYAGRAVESGSPDAIFHRQQHPYTRGLLESVPRVDTATGRLRAIAGQSPDLRAVPPGCAFAPRCPHAFERCVAERPRLRDAAAGHRVACHLDGLP